ncbi:MAG: L,D-transpeptidase family protein [Gammaproteobacteria bacterium]|nr:L,D-transpeptidase family protein [Gammaproteobacteria bacterium]
MKPSLIGVLLVFGLAAAHAASPVDRVVVKKSEAVLQLMIGEQVIRQFPIYLGGNPIGHKQHQGDRRTPEGRYLLHERKAKSRFYRALRVSYPNNADQAAAKAAGKSPGGDIMIHGMPSLEKRSLLMFDGRNWTDGCIAISNPHMREVWDLVDLGTPIEILP